MRMRALKATKTWWKKRQLKDKTQHLGCWNRQGDRSIMCQVRCDLICALAREERKLEWSKTGAMLGSIRWTTTIARYAISLRFQLHWNLPTLRTILSGRCKGLNWRNHATLEAEEIEKVEEKSEIISQLGAL